MLMEVLSPLQNETDETLRVLWRYLSEQNQRIACGADPRPMTWECYCQA